MNYFLGYNFPFFNNIFSSFLSFFNDFNYGLLMGILMFLSISLCFLIINGYIFKSFNVIYQSLELNLALIPIIIILVQMWPSLGILFVHNSINSDSHLTVKVTGHQWYWEYNIMDFDKINEEKGNFDSYLVNLGDLKIINLSQKALMGFGDFDRCNSVDNRLILPMNMMIRFLVSSSDVIHSFSLQGNSIKLDAMAGLLNVQNTLFSQSGIFNGYCSEICGTGHSNMPMIMEISSVFNFLNYYI